MLGVTRPCHRLVAMPAAAAGEAVALCGVGFAWSGVCVVQEGEERQGVVGFVPETFVKYFWALWHHFWHCGKLLKAKSPEHLRLGQGTQGKP